MENTLQRLLQAEQRAEKLVDEAKVKRDEIIRKALEDTRRTEQRLDARIPEIHQSYLDKSVARANQALKEVVRRYETREQELRSLAEKRNEDAISAVVHLLSNPEKG